MEQLEELKARYAKDPEHFSRRTANDAVLAEFHQQFPPSRLAALTLEEYCLGTGSRPKNFSWWLERGLQPVLGRYMPGTSRGHLLYRLKDGTYYKHGALSDLTDTEALKYVMALTSAIASLKTLEEGQAFDPPGALAAHLKLEARMEMGEARRLRIFGIYHPDEIVPINSPIHIAHFLKILGLPPDKIESGAFGLAVQLWGLYLEAKKEMHGLTPWGFSRLLYDPAVGLAPQSSYAEPEPVAEDGEANTELSPRNVILYGPPGTGKTYRSIDYAVQILDPQAYKFASNDRSKLLAAFNKARAEGRVAFVTFHQSFSYEDFVEGLKADSDESGQVVYRPTDGIFKKMCDVAASRQVQHSDRTLDPRGRAIWKMSLGNAKLDDRFDECIQAGVAGMGFAGRVDFTGCISREDIKSKLSESGVDLSVDDHAVSPIEYFVTLLKEGDVIVVSEGNHKFRAIGEVAGPYFYSADANDGVDFPHRRKVDWVRVYSPSLPVDELLSKIFVQRTIYRLAEPNLDMAKLVSLLSQAAPTPRVFSKGEKIGSYVVEEIGPENLTVRKPKSGGTLHMPWSILDELAGYLRAGKVSVQDIKECKVFSKVDSNLEKHFVNGYPNLLAPMVERIVSGAVQDKNPEAQARVLIIDEINRGNVSKIFGELITLIEDNKRAGRPEALSVTLPYSRSHFSVPSNLFLIGTMNTADRSLTGLDIALRRRFQMVHVPPDPSLLKGIVVEGVDVSRMLAVLNQRLELMVGSDLLIGHSYFLGLRGEASLASLKRIFLNSILPLLQEYFFEDSDKIYRVLGDHGKPAELRIMTRQLDDEQIQTLLGDDWNLASGAGWRVNAAALDEPGAYRGIYERAEQA